jgi:hypothetical protein
MTAVTTATDRQAGMATAVAMVAEEDIDPSPGGRSDEASEHEQAI